MRFTSLAALSMLAAMACAGEQPAPRAAAAPVAPPPPTPPPAEEPAPPPPPAKPALSELIPQTMKALADAFNAHDPKKVADSFTADCVVSAFGAPSARGRDELARGLQAFFDFVGDARSANLRVWVSGNVVVDEFAWAGTMTGDFMGIKATKKALGAMRVQVLVLTDDGLLAQIAGKKGAPAVPSLPTNPPQVHTATGAPPGEEAKLAEWARSIDEVFSKDDAKAAAALMADDADYWQSVSFGPATKGKKDLTKDLERWFSAFPDQKWTTTSAMGVDGFAIVEHTMSGTQKGRLGPLPASNKVVSDWHWIDILQPSAEGNVQHGWGYANLIEMMQQTGALRPPGGEKKPAAAAKGATADAAAKNQQK